MVREGPDAVRARVRDWLAGLLEAEGVGMGLSDPADWSGWDRGASAVSSEPNCPFCDSEEVEVVAAWGGQLITSQLRCRACNTHFEALRDAFSPPQGEDDQARGWTSS